MVGTARNNVLIAGIILFVIYPFFTIIQVLLFAGDEVVLLVASLHHDEVYNVLT